MKETLFIRLRDASPAPVMAAARWSPQGGFRDVSGALETLAAQAAGCRVVVFVPAGEVRIALLDIAARSPQKVLQAAPYALEEQIADDVEDLHFALGPRLPSGGYPVALVARSVIDAWLALLETHGIQADEMVPEQLALPWSGDDRLHALVESDRVLVRSAQYQSFVCATTDLPLYLQLADADRRYGLRLFVLPESPTEFGPLERPLDLLPGHRSALEVLVKHWRDRESLNLRQGALAPRREMDRVWGPWRLPAGLAAAWLIVALGAQGLQAFQISREASAQEAANVQRYQSLFPDEQRIVDLAAQAEQKMAAMRSGGGQNGVLRMMEPVAQALGAVQGLSIQSLQFREGSIYLNLNGRDLQTLEQLRGWFESHPGTAFEVQSANAGAEGVQIRLKLSPA